MAQWLGGSDESEQVESHLNVGFPPRDPAFYFKMMLGGKKSNVSFSF